jgi:hypothetical protein
MSRGAPFTKEDEARLLRSREARDARNDVGGATYDGADEGVCCPRHLRDQAGTNTVNPVSRS